MILNLVVIQNDNVKNKFCKCFRKFKFIIKRVDIRKWKDTLETEIYAKYISDKGPLSTIYKEFIKLEQRK